MDLELLKQGTESSRPTLLFIHGAYHDAQCWDVHIMPWLAEKGWHCCAVSLRGHGNSPGDAATDQPSFSDYLDDINHTIDQLGTPVILIGHSMGGVIAEQIALLHDKVVGVALLAPSPQRPALSVILRSFINHPVNLIKGQFFGDDAAFRTMFMGSFFAPDMPRDDRLKAEAMIGTESRRAMTDLFNRPKIDPATIPDIPYLVIGGIGDWSIPKRKLVPLAKQYNTPLVMVPGPHDLMFDQNWTHSADALFVWLMQNFD